MSMRPFIIDEKVKKQLHSLRDYAEQNPLSLQQLEAMSKGEIPVAGDMKGYSAYLPFRYKVVLTINVLENKTLRQFSMSANSVNRTFLPNPHVVELTMPFLGFTKPLSECIIDFERVKNGHAIVVAEVMSER